MDRRNFLALLLGAPAAALVDRASGAADAPAAAAAGAPAANGRAPADPVGPEARPWWARDGSLDGDRAPWLLQVSPLAGFSYHQAPRVWSSLRLGDVLLLVREPRNPHDPRAVAISWHGYKLGYVPRRDNAAVAQLLDRRVFVSGTIARLDEQAPTWERVGLALWVGAFGAQEPDFGPEDIDSEAWEACLRTESPDDVARQTKWIRNLHRSRAWDV